LEMAGLSFGWAFDLPFFLSRCLLRRFLLAHFPRALVGEDVILVGGLNELAISGFI